MSTPRILPAHLHAFAPGSATGTVRMLGTITTVSGDQATLTCGSDAVTILLNRYEAPSAAHVPSPRSPAYDIQLTYHVFLPEIIIFPSTRYTKSSAR